MEQIKYGIIHAHTEHSLKDSVLSPQILCKRAAELGAPAVVMTDHGVLTGVFEFMKAAEANGIKGIPGVEAYVQEDDSLTKREHLLLIPKNFLGYQAISKAVTMSNMRMHDKHPCVNIDILEQCFGVGSKGHGNVISTSACVGGILSKVLLKNRSLEVEAEKIRNKMKKCNSPEDPAYIVNKKECDRLNCEIKDTMTKRDALAKTAARKFKQKERSLNALPVGSAEYAEFKAKLNAEKFETESAVRELETVKKRIAELNKLKKIVHGQCSEAEKTHSRWKINKEALDKILNGMKSDHELYEEAKAKALKYSDIFGENNFYIELQYHRITDETYVMPLLAKLADELNLPIVACNDIHYANNTKDDIRARQLINSLRFNKWSPLREGDTEYYIKTDEELKEILTEILSSETVEKALQGIGEIVSRCDVQLPKEKHYPKFVDETGESAKDRLRRLAKEGISKRYKANEWTEEHEKRMEYELEIIEEQGYSDYLCIVEDFLSYARARVKDNPEKVGLSVGPGRGSAVGSLVCYLSGITGIDPMKYGLIFERFLNRERVSMPDIDSDFDIDIRGEVLEYVQNKYGKDAVCNILAMGTLAAKAAIRNVARVTGDERCGDTSAFMDIGDAIAKAIPKTPDIQLSDVEEELREKFKDNEDALRIIDDAKLIEGAALQYSTHAAGVVISDNGDVSEYISLMQNDDGLIMCQCNMVEAEENAGLLKMDFLGLRNLNIISATLRDIKRNYGISLDMEEIGRSLVNGVTTPFDKSGNVFSDIFSKGKTNGVFQFESAGMKSMLKKFQPSNIDDLILLVAAYRPGPIQYLDDIVAVKHHKKKPEYVIPEMESVLGATYGSPIFQEQIMEIFNKFAGFSLGEADILRRYMSKKKVEKFAAYKDKFIDGLIERGAEPQKAEDFWEQLLQFSKYAFNKSHACAYAIVAFYTAWLKLNYSVEYMTALLNYAKSDSKQTKQEKISAIVNECKNMGIAVLPPDINSSGYDFKNKNGDIIFGLGSIKGIKSAANTIIETRNAERFHSFKDFITRTPINKTVIEGCIYSGALDCWGQNRVAMQVVFPEIVDTYAKEKEAESKLHKLESKLLEHEKEIRRSIGDSDDEVLDYKLLQKFVQEKKLKKNDLTLLNKLKTRISDYKEALSIITIPIDIPQSKKVLLDKEKLLMGIYLSGHPLDEYKDIQKHRTHAICDAEVGNVTMSGIIEDIKIKNRKSDGNPMAFFTLSDETGSIEACCFVRAYAENKEHIFPENVVSIKGRCVEEDSIYEDEEEILKLNVQEIRTLPRTKQSVLISVKSIVDWTESVYNRVLAFKGTDYDVFVHDQMTGEIRETTGLEVSTNILNANIPGTDISIFS